MEFLVAEWIGKPIWMWLGFFSIVLALLAFDLGVLHKEDKEMGIAESLYLSAFYISFAMLYGGCGPVLHAFSSCLTDLADMSTVQVYILRVGEEAFGDGHSHNRREGPAGRG